ncbi:hypothetical protein VTH82DRAFT_420 [Thermothelomyces myriococcoides]
MYLPQLLPKSALPDNSHSSAAAVSSRHGDGPFWVASESESVSVAIPSPATRGSPLHRTLLPLIRNDQHQHHHAVPPQEYPDQSRSYYHALTPRQPLPSPASHDRKGRNVHGWLRLHLHLQLQGRNAGSMRAQNVTIGIVVGVLLAVFLAGFFFFVWRYHQSIRIRRRSGRRRRYSKGSRSSGATAVGAADGGGGGGGGG